MARAGVVLPDCAIWKCCRIDIVGFPRFDARIKPKKPSRKRAKAGNRQTLAKRIRELAQTDTFAAALLAGRGKQFSKIETLLNLYYGTLKEYRKVQAGEKTTIEKLLAVESGWTRERIAAHRAEYPKSLQNFAFQISQILIDAIVLRDSRQIIEIANAVEFLKSPPKPPADPWRSKILYNKHVLIESGEQWEIGQWAKILGWSEDEAEDGFPHLRRLLKELDAPLKPTRQIRRK